jgi:hypothetical protein
LFAFKSLPPAETLWKSDATAVEGTYLAADSGRMAKKSNDQQSTPLPLWSIHRAAHKAIWIGEVKVPATKLMATRRR